jgi:hypothetical protein
MVHSDYNKYLSYFLFLIGIHSFAVGVVLLFISPSVLNFFGLIDYKESFFQAQGGVFHIAMSIAYTMAGLNIEKSKRLIQFIIAVKFLAFVFLILYYLFVFQAWLILLSGIGDGLMGLIVFILYQRSKLKLEEY